jgi:hypothetical protein
MRQSLGADSDDPDRAARIRLLIGLVIAAFVCLTGALLLVRWLEPWRRPVLPGRALQLRVDASPLAGAQR